MSALDAGEPEVEVREVLREYGLGAAEVNPISVGLINRTFLVSADGRRSVLQHVNPIFTWRVHLDIDAVTRHVMSKDRGLLMPRLIPARSGALFVEREGRIWRLLEHVPGVTHERLAQPEQAREAGALLARFHRAVADLEHEFQNRRLGVHDTPKHLATLARALEEHRGTHPRHGVVGPLGEEILALAHQLPALPPAPDRVVHGDPKISNLLFDAVTGRGVAIVDLDTLARMPLALELGDALRSWCNPLGEDHTSVSFSLPLFQAAVEGYASEAAGLVTPAEQAALAPATLTIIVELASRFGADALNEVYFGWDRRRFATRGEHNELRARGQLALARSLQAVLPEAEGIVQRAFRGA